MALCELVADCHNRYPEEIPLELSAHSVAHNTNPRRSRSNYHHRLLEEVALELWILVAQRNRPKESPSAPTGWDQPLGTQHLASLCLRSAVPRRAVTAEHRNTCVLSLPRSLRAQVWGARHRTRDRSMRVV